MGLNQRHRIFALGAVNAGSKSAAVDLSAFDSFMVYATSVATATLSLEASPDGGTTWFAVTNSIATWTGAESRTLPLTTTSIAPSRIRVSVLTANMSGVWIEGIRGT